VVAMCTVFLASDAVRPTLGPLLLWDGVCNSLRRKFD
jgi:hypothetical protein